MMARQSARREVVKCATIAGAALVVISLTWSGVNSYALAKDQPGVVRQVDHVVLEVREVAPLFAFFSNTLNLPVAWAVDRNVSPPSFGYESGGVYAGNVALETVRDLQWSGRFVRGKNQGLGGVGASLGDSKAILGGFAFEPYPRSSAIQELDLRGIAHGTPQSFAGKLADGGEAIFFRTVDLGEPFGNAFLCEFTQNGTDLRAKLHAEFISRHGGPLTVKRVKEIVVETPDLDAAISRWRKLLAPIAMSSPGLWNIGDGPALHLVRGAANHEALVIEVESMQRAREFLHAKGMLSTASDGSVAISPAKIDGLDIRLTEVAGQPG